MRACKFYLCWWGIFLCIWNQCCSASAGRGGEESLGVWEGRGRGSGQEKAARGRGERFIVTTEEAGFGSASLSSFVIFLNSLHLRALRHSHYYSSLAFTVKHTLLSYQNVTLHEFIDCIDEFSLIRLFYRVWICLGVCMRPVMRWADWFVTSKSSSIIWSQCCQEICNKTTDSRLTDWYLTGCSVVVKPTKSQMKCRNSCKGSK